MVTCSNCHTTVASTDRIYCPSCGAELPNQTGQPSSVSSGRHSNKNRNTQSKNSVDCEPSNSSQNSEETTSQSGEQTTQEQTVPPSQRTSGQASESGGYADHSSRTGANPDQLPQSERHSGKASSPENRPERHSSNQIEGFSRTDGQQTQTADQPNSDRRQSDSSRRSGDNSPLVSAISRNTSVPDVNTVAWWIGWHPLAIISIFTLIPLALLVTLEIDTFELAVLGPLIGMVVWYWGVREINTNYKGFRSAFFGCSAKRAEDRLAIDESEVIDTFNFRSHTGSSPPLVEPSEFYRADHLILSDVSVSVDKGSRFDMKDRAAASTGTTKNIYYDNIETITTNDEGNITNLKIVTSSGDDLQAVTVDQNVAEQAQGRLRSEMRDVRRARY